MWAAAPQTSSSVWTLYFGLFTKHGVGSGAQDVIGASHKCHMKSGKHPEWLPASLAFLNTRDLGGVERGVEVGGDTSNFHKSLVHPIA